LLHACSDPPTLHSFPTRRSSDLLALQGIRRPFDAFDEWPVEPVRVCHRIGILQLRQADAALLQIVRHEPEHHLALPHDALKQFEDRKSTRLNSSHVKISYAVFCL